MGKDKSKIKILFCGKNADDVTGSCIYIETPHRKIVLECGLHQACKNKKQVWNINTEKFAFKAKEIDYLFAGHASHTDHSGRIPLFYKRGGSCQTILPQNTKQLVEILWRDSAHIIASDAEEFSKKYGKPYEPFYNVGDVENALEHVVEYPENELIVLDEYVKFRFLPSGHVVNNCQLELWITEGNVTKKILYTSDLGNEHIEKDYVRPLQRVQKADIVIGESTYAGQPKIADENMRSADLDKLRCVIEQTGIDEKGRILIPSFAVDRTQTILTVLYKMFGHDPALSLPIYIDSPMAQNVCRVYRDILNEDDSELWDEVLAWENVRFVSDYIESRELRESKKPCIVIASSGFLIAGRSVAWLASLLPRSNDRVVFIGYAPPGSIAYDIKNQIHKTISITGKRYSNRCQVTNLGSFTSHIQRDSLLDYYSSIECQKVCLVHGEMEGKITFAKELQERIFQNNNTAKVVCVNLGTEITL